MTNDVTHDALQDYCQEAEASRDEAVLAEPVQRPGLHRSKVLSIRLNDDEYEELIRYADTAQVPLSGLVRGWILDRLAAGSDSPQDTIERMSQELNQLRRQIAA